MNFENINRINTPIETEDNKEREEKLNEKIEQISLIYANKKFQDIKKENPDYKFSDALKTYSLAKENILKPYYILENTSFNDNKEKIDIFLDDFYKEADDIIDLEGFNLDEILELINLKKGIVVEYLGITNLEVAKIDNKNYDTKIIKFGKIDDFGYRNNKDYQPLLKLGFCKQDQLLNVHFDNFFSNDEKNLGPELIKSDLSIIAEHIIKQHPETAAVVGRSWLLDTPIAERLGFKRIADDTIRENDTSTWSQFIDKNGQIDQKRFNKFLESGELPFTSVKAYIPVKEFLSRYLPDNLKGKITLKEIDKEAALEQEKFNEEIQSLKDIWSNALKNGKFEEIVNNPTLNKAFSFISAEEGEKYMVYFKRMFDLKIEDFSKMRDDEIDVIGKKLNENMKKSLYRDKEVVIE